MRALPAAAAVLLATLVLLPAGARGQGKKKGTPAASASLPRDTVGRLASDDPAQVKAALDDVRMAARDGAPAVPAVSERLKRGLPRDLTLAALDTLGDTESEAASEVLSWYARHRDPGIRRAAVSALAKTRGAAAAKALRAALSDADPGVRGLSATGLGALKARDAVPDLFAALDHKVPEAAASIGQLCAGPECERLAAKLGSVPFDVVSSGLDQVLFRGGADVDDDLKVNIVGRLRELGTAEANRFLREVQGRWSPAGSRRVKQSIDQAVLATASSPGGGAP